MPSNELKSHYFVQETEQMLENNFHRKSKERTALNKNIMQLNLDDDESDYLSCEESDDEPFFDFEPSHILAETHHDQSSITSQNLSENLNNNFTKKSLIQTILNWFRILIQYLRNTWFSNKLNSEDPITDRNSSMKNSDSHVKQVNTSENSGIVSTISNLNNQSTLTPLSSHPNAFYQATKKEDCHLENRVFKYSLN